MFALMSLVRTKAMPCLMLLMMIALTSNPRVLAAGKSMGKHKKMVSILGQSRAKYLCVLPYSFIQPAIK